MQKLVNKITKFAEDNDYIVMVDNHMGENDDIELIVIDNTKQAIFFGSKANYLSNPNMEE